MKVYVLTQSSGEYEDYRNIVIGVYKNKEDAEKVKVELDEECLNVESKYPMSELEYEELNYGYDEDGITLINKGKYTIKDFELMDKLKCIEFEDYHPCEIEEHELL